MGSEDDAYNRAMGERYCGLLNVDRSTDEISNQGPTKYPYKD